jgi:hypothetical protein
VQTSAANCAVKRCAKCAISVHAVALCIAYGGSSRWCIEVYVMHNVIDAVVIALRCGATSSSATLAFHCR